MNTLYPARLLAKRLGLLLVFYFCFRVLFFLANRDALSGDGASDILWSFLNGLRFDLWAVLWSSLPIIFAAFLPVRWQERPWLQAGLLIYVGAVQIWCFGLNVIDVELFKFTGRRLSMDWLHLQQDLEHQSLSLVSYYWWLALLGTLAWLVFMWLWPRWNLARENSRPLALRIATVVLGITFLALGLRGGTQYKPLSLNHAYTRGSAALGVLTHNSTFSFFKNRRRVDSLALRFFNSKEEAVSELAALHRPTSTRHGELKNRNVVILIVESLGSEYVGVLNKGEGLTPFFDELSKKGDLFTENFANGRRSIEAIPSVICGLPSMMGEALIVSPYQGIELHCLGNYAKSAGYSTHFFHGAYNGSMHFDTFAHRAGFDNYYGFNEFGDATKSDGIWGIYDEPFLQFALEKLNSIPEPFAATIFTLSSHHPYKIPPELAGRFTKGNLEIHPSIQYSDYALKQFFAKAERQPWFANTLFVITGDHTGKSGRSEYKNLLGYYRVPLLVYAPGLSSGQVRNRVTQHIDILPTVLDLLGLPGEPRLKIGQSVFADDPGVAFNGDERGYWLYTSSQLVQYGHGTGEFSESSQLVRDRLKAVVHYFNVGVTGNTLYRF